MNKNDIEQVSNCFREAIDRAKSNREFDWKYDNFHFDRMNSFPRGCCDDACDLLCHYFYVEYGVKLIQKNGYYKAENAHHNWLETSDGIVVDLTSDQFFARPKVFANYDDGFYSEMRDVKEIQAFCILKDERLKRDYEVILHYLNGIV